MQQKQIFYKSDFSAILSFTGGWSTPFRLKFWTNSPSRSFVASYDGSTYTNCSVTSDGRLQIAFDNHNMGLGTLMLQPEFYLTNEAYADGICNEVITPFSPTFKDSNNVEYNVVLGMTGASTMETIGTLPAYYQKGDKGDKGDTGATGATGPQGPAGSDATVTKAKVVEVLGFTPANSNHTHSASEITDGNKNVHQEIEDIASKILEKPTATGTQGQVLSLDAQGKTIWKDESGGGSGSTPMVSLTYAQLKAKRDGGQLVAGTQYRITDYVTTTVQEDTQSAGHAFDVIVVADSASTLNEDARAILHEGDSYFANCDLNAWELKYCLDNDTTRFEWADATNGKGVIYRMKDEWGNDVPYDFKNIQYLKSSYVYTFGGSKDNSLDGNCRNNVIDVYRYDSKYKLNCIIFGSSCYNNTFGKNCFNNYFSYVCYNNTFGNNCSDNHFGNFCYFNNIGEGSNANVFGNECHYNTFGVFLRQFYSGNNLNNIVIGNNCSLITFGTSSAPNNYYSNIIIDGQVNYIYLNCEEELSHTSYLKNVHICSGVSGTSSSRKTITIPTAGNSFLTTVYMNEAGTICYEKSGEVASKVEDIGLEFNRVDDDINEVANGDYGQPDYEALPLLCGQPPILFGAGTPQEAVVPTNWKQFSNGGYNWNGLPSAIGQVYINTSATSNGRYTAYQKADGTLAWLNF